jgi:hypothetical protein
MRKPATLPTAPWDAVPGENKHMKHLINDWIGKKVGPSDMLYMAQAILQLSDELFELRERMKAMELAHKERGVSP